MVGASKILTVSYGTFSCTLEGFDDSFSTMKAIAEYFRDLASDDRYFGAEPPTPDAEMLARIAEREVQKRVEAKIEDNGVVLRTAAALTGDTIAEAPAPEEAAPAEPAAEPAPAPVETADSDSVAAKLQRIRAVVDKNQSATAPAATYSEDEHADEMLAEASEPNPEFAAEFANTQVAEDVVEDDTAAQADLDAVANDNSDIETEAEVEAEAEVEVEVEAVAEVETEVEFEAEFEAEADVAAEEETEAEIEAEAETEEFEIDEYEEEADELRAFDRDDFSSVLSQVADEEPREPEAPAAEAQEAEDEDEDEDEDEPSTLAELAREELAAASYLSAVEEDHAEEDHTETEDEAPVAAFEEEEAEAEEEFEEEFEAEAEAEAEEEIEAAAEDEEEEPARGARKARGPSAAALRARARAIRVAKIDLAEAESIEAAAEETEVAEEPEEAEETSEAVEEPAIVEPVKFEGEAEATFSADQDDEAEFDEQIDEPEVGDDEIAALAVSDDEIDALADEMADEDEEIGETALSPEAEAELMNELADVAGEDTPRPEHDGRAHRLDASGSEDEADVTRLMDETESQFDKPESTRRRSAIAHLRAAVAATVADRRVIGKSKGRDDTDAYRADLAEVVRPGLHRTEAEDDAGDVRREKAADDDRPAPLMLVSEQRIDTHEDAPEDELAAIRPRRAADLTSDEIDDDDDDEDGNMFAESASFADFAEQMGATELPDLLEAAAAYTSYIEGHEHFSRPQIMKRAAKAGFIDEFSREEGLRSFGKLLRQGKIKKIKRGQFEIAQSTRFKPEARIAGE